MDLLTLFSTALGAYSTISGFKTGKDVSVILEKVDNQSDGLLTITENAFYLPKKNIVTPKYISADEFEVVANPQELILDMQQYLDSPVISSDILTTKNIFKGSQMNPRDILIGSQPLEDRFLHTERDMIAVIYYENGIPYIGWQKKVLINSIFGIEFHPENWNNNVSNEYLPTKKIYLPTESKFSHEKKQVDKIVNSNDNSLSNINNNEIELSEKREFLDTIREFDKKENFQDLFYLFFSFFFSIYILFMVQFLPAYVIADIIRMVGSFIFSYWICIFFVRPFLREHWVNQIIPFTTSPYYSDYVAFIEKYEWKSNSRKEYPEFV